MKEDIKTKLFMETSFIGVVGISGIDSDETAAKLHQVGSPIHADDIVNTEFVPLKWIVDGIDPEGLGLMVGQQDLPSSWLCIDKLIDVETGDDGKESMESHKAANDNTPINEANNVELSSDESEGE